MYSCVDCGIILLNLNNFKKQKKGKLCVLPKTKSHRGKKSVIFFWPYRICTVVVVVVAIALYFWNSLPGNRSVLGVEGP